VQQATAPPGVKRKLAAILSADVKGYSRLMAADEEGTLRPLSAYRQEMDALVAARDGRIVGTAGDSVLAEFASAVEAARCAVEIQEELAKRNAELPKDRRLEFRIGINLGDVMVEGDDLFGDGVNVAARLQALAEPGGIYVSGGIYDQVRGKLPFGADFLGEQTVKNIAEPVRVYRLRSDRATVRRAIPRRWRTWSTITAAVGLLAIVAAGTAWYFDLWRASGPTDEEQASVPPRPDRPSIAVLPFGNLSDDPEEEYFADGLTDDLITDLSKISGLFIIARNSVFAYKDRPVDLRKVARELGVRYVLEGSVRRAGDHVRINAQLNDSETGGQLWADRFDRDVSDIFAVQDEVIRHIVDALAIQLSAPEQKRLARLPTTNLEAYDYYLRAEQAARTGFQPKLRQALHLYEKAIALDPAFAEAYAADARTVADVMRNDYNDVLVGPLARKRAYEHASRALELAPDASLPFAVLAVLQAVDGRHDEALASAKRAVALGPSDAEAQAALSFVLTFSGRHADALAAVETALRLNPSLPTGDRIIAALTFLLNEEPERAVAILEYARAEAPDFDTIHTLLTAAYARAGRADDARRAAVEAIRLGPLNSVELYRLVYAYFRRNEDLARILDALRAGGLPEWPHGFRPDGYERVSGAEISRLALGRTWQGHLEGGGPAVEQIQSDGRLAFRTTTYIATGTAFVEGNMLCEQFEGLSFGRPVCGPVYRRTEHSDNDLAYTYVNGTKVFHFAPIE
jgi:TolB-like protein/class 3 adenylate cyclase/Flp pilus assembly protein TadD